MRVHTPRSRQTEAPKTAFGCLSMPSSLPPELGRIADVESFLAAGNLLDLSRLSNVVQQLRHDRRQVCNQQRMWRSHGSVEATDVM